MGNVMLMMAIVPPGGWQHPNTEGNSEKNYEALDTCNDGLRTLLAFSVVGAVQLHDEQGGDYDHELYGQ